MSTNEIPQAPAEETIEGDDESGPLDFLFEKEPQAPKPAAEEAPVQIWQEDDVLARPGIRVDQEDHGHAD